MQIRNHNEYKSAFIKSENVSTFFQNMFSKTLNVGYVYEHRFFSQKTIYNDQNII